MMKLIKNKQILFRIIAIILAITVFFIPFCQTITWTRGDVVTTYGNTYDFIFGNQITGNGSFPIDHNSLYLLISLIFAVLAVLFTCFSFIRNKIIHSLFTLFSVILLITSAILSFSSHYELSFILSTAVTGNYNEHVVETFYKNTYLNFGVLGIGLFEIVSAIILFVLFLHEGTFIKKIKNLIYPKNIKNSKKVNKKQIAYRLIVLTFVVILLLISFLSPFMLIEGANTTLGIAIAGTIFGIYVIVCLALIFDKN